MTTKQPATITIRTPDDEAARLTQTLMRTFGHRVVREFESPEDARHWATENLARRYKLTPPEQLILEFVIDRGGTNEQIAETLAVSRATVKWHMHNIFAKTGAGGREALLRLAIGEVEIRPADEKDPDLGRDRSAEATPRTA